jgi:carbon-monoxide dehydrogenase medium subunit
VLLNLNEVAELRGWSREDGTIRLGAALTYSEAMESPLAGALPALAEASRTVGGPQIRNRGTIGGSIAHGDPASDLPAVVLALGGTLVARGPGGERTIPATDFFTGFLETALAPDELLTEIRVPKVAGAGWSYQKFNRRALDWAIVGVAAVKNGHTGLALVNMGSTPLRATAVEQALGSGASIEDAAMAAPEGTEPPTDLNASPDYRRHLAQVLVRRALQEAGG